MSNSPSDLVKIWPKLFNLAAAKRAVKDGLPLLPGLVPFHYQVKGERQKVRLAYYDPKIITDPLQWLQKRLKKPLILPGVIDRLLRPQRLKIFLRIL